MQIVQPIADAGVSLLRPTGINPLFIVLTHAVLGFIAAGMLMAQPSGFLLTSALLLQAKTLLDNMDGGLARATGQITLMGRYFDTGMDFFVNIALFVALAFYGPAWQSLIAFSLLTLILSLDYNAERLYKLEHYDSPKESEAPIGAPRPLYAFFKAVYDFVLAPQDRAIAKLDKVHFKKLSGVAFVQAPKKLRLAWADLFSTASLVNLGLSTQLFVLGICLLLRQPFWYVYSLYLQALYVLVIQLIRGVRFRRYLRNFDPSETQADTRADTTVKPRG